MPITTETTLVSDISSLKKCLSILSQSSALYLDLEGFKLSRYGTIAIITILAHPSKQTRLIDVSSLGKSAFSTTSDDGTSLKSVLEDPRISKYIWDVRNDANALWFLYGVNLHAVTDIQLLENASRLDDRTYVRGLDKCIQYDLKLSYEDMISWLQTKKDVQNLMQTDVFSTRPMDSKVSEYCLNDIVHLPALRQIYTARLKPEWLSKVADESQRRVAGAKTTTYDPKSDTKKLGPWGSYSYAGMIVVRGGYHMPDSFLDDGYEYDDHDDDLFYDDPLDCEDFGALDSD